MTRLVFTFGTLYDDDIITVLLGEVPRNFYATLSGYAIYKGSFDQLPPKVRDYFAAKGYTVLFLHYFDATGSSMPSRQNYVLWAKAVEDLVRECQSTPAWADRKIALMGLSLGASVALAAGSQNARVSAIADWYGSLPDDFLPKLKGMPPLLILHGNRDDVIPIINAQQLVRLCGMEHFACESHFYQDQGHGFMKGALEDADARTLDFFARTMK